MMAASVSVRIDGLQQLQRRMRYLSDQVQNKISKAAVGAAANLVKKEAIKNIQQNATIDTGSLLGAVIVKRIPPAKTRLAAEYIVTVRGRGKKKPSTKSKTQYAPHAFYLEFGTVRMSRKYPFLKPAFDDKKNQAVEVIAAKLKRALDKAGR